MDESTIYIAEKELMRLDPILGSLISIQTLRPKGERRDYFASLCRSIIGQQVSVSSANAVYARLEEKTDTRPLLVCNLEQIDIKYIGLSRQKASYLNDLAAHFIDNPDIYNHLEAQTDNQIIEELTRVRGIGVWTAQMFLMFTLGRPDVFAPDDAGLVKAVCDLYDLKNPTKAQLVEKSLQWKPFRTTASLHLWHSLHNTAE